MNALQNFFKRNTGFAAALILLGLFTVFYWSVLFNGQVFVFIDASRFFFPMWKWGAGVLHQGLLPLWNPDAQFGTPYLADPQTACAYPPVFLFYSWFSPVNAFSALVLFHHFWCALGTWFWMRRQGFSFASSLLGSLAFSFSAHVVCSAWTPVALMAISWLPWVLTAAEEVFDKKPRGFLWLSLAWAMQLSAGYPVLVYLTGLALLVNFGWRSYFRSKASGFERFAWLAPLAGSALVAILYNAVWELPFLEFFRNSNYQSGGNRSQDLSWVNLATFLDPFFSGHPVEGKDPGFDYWVGTYFVGLPMLFLFLWGIWKKVYRKNNVFIFVLFFVLSLGSTLGLATLLKSFWPGYSLVIHSGFWISLVLLWLTALAVEAMDEWTMGTSTSPWIAGLIVLLVYGSAWALKKPYFPMLFIASAVVLLMVINARSPRFRVLLVTIALVLSLAPTALSLNMTLDRSYYERPPEILSHLEKSGRLFFSPLVMTHGVRLQGSDMASAYESAKGSLYPNWPLAYGREEAPIYNTLQMKNSWVWTTQAFRYSLYESRTALNYLGVRYLFGGSSFSDLKKVPGTGEVQVWENPKASPKWFSVSRAISASSKIEDDLSMITKKSIDLLKTCFIGDEQRAGTFELKTVAEIKRTPNSVVLSVSKKGKGLLVSSETEAPGWKVWVDGHERNVELIDHAFRGVVVNEGEEKIIQRYEPLSFRLGLFLSMLMIGFWILIMSSCSLTAGRD